MPEATTTERPTDPVPKEEIKQEIKQEGQMSAFGALATPKEEDAVTPKHEDGIKTQEAIPFKPMSPDSSPGTASPQLMLPAPEKFDMTNTLDQIRRGFPASQYDGGRRQKNWTKRRYGTSTTRNWYGIHSGRCVCACIPYTAFWVPGSILYFWTRWMGKTKTSGIHVASSSARSYSQPLWKWPAPRIGDSNQHYIETFLELLGWVEQQENCGRAASGSGATSRRPNRKPSAQPKAKKFKPTPKGPPWKKTQWKKARTKRKAKSSNANKAPIQELLALYAFCVFLWTDHTPQKGRCTKIFPVQITEHVVERLGVDIDAIHSGLE
ncbi:hypothetical protein CYLTODRAFT_414654 [Cylindrobasidium torrendii FP15055 ss-10]|uniref:Uncharacterized protein n=1 Tax=Cylindrobasidium torrendii FP15055 ss-10 TaxID=1314674 RepID=A0A0D7AX28_9AGAR|nr:hypothetical protein CYLTODRAFT_414654 [Cylindrobasidium torrendii FP15055 ss-10]